jgi:hypothetical protein
MIPAGILPEVIAAPSEAVARGRPRPGDLGREFQHQLQRAQIAGWLTTTPTRSEAPSLSALPGLFHGRAVAAGAFVTPAPGIAESMRRMQPLMAQLTGSLGLQASLEIAAAQDDSRLPSHASGASIEVQKQAASPSPRHALLVEGLLSVAGALKPLPDVRGPLPASCETTLLPTRLTAPETPQPPVRLHAEWTADGVRLWLALDADVQHQLAAITLQLRRWMLAQGVRVIEFSCNGRPVEPAAHTEEPWPSAP